jgi:catechol 2,3-dioxygenase-like lactoylglutathione lyase family enzyme
MGGRLDADRTVRYKYRMILGIHHVQITIPAGEEDAARAFYCRLLGLAEIPKPENRKGRGGFWLQVANAEVHVGTEVMAPGPSTKAHIAYEVSDLDACRKTLEGSGIAVSEGLGLPGYRSLEMRDPFGNRLELLGRLTES